MKTNRFTNLVLFLIVSASCQQSQQRAQNTKSNEVTESAFEAVDVYLNPNSFDQLPRLKPGDTPPAMKIEKWFNGGAIDSFEPGKVYIVEFFASWCQPCRKSIPHLNKLQKEFKNDLVVVGVAASESEANSDRLEKLLLARQDILTYRVAYTSDENTFKDWNWGARNTGLPWVFIIDKKGKLAWYGQPFQSRFEPVLRSVLNDSYLSRYELEAIERLLDKRTELWKIQEQFWEAIGEENWQAAMSLGNQLYESSDQIFYYEMAEMFYVKYMEQGEKEEALEFARNLSNGLLKSIPEGLSYMSRTISQDPEVSSIRLKWALDLAVKANELSLNENPEVLNLLGTIHMQDSNFIDANRIFVQALELNDDAELAQELRGKLLLLEEMDLQKM